MKHDFEILQKFIDEMKNTSKLNDKKQILNKYKSNEFIVKVLSYTFNPFKKYHVSPANLIKNKNLISDYKGDLFSLLDELSERVFTGHDAISFVNGFIAKNEKYKEIIHYILDRNLQIRADDKVINKIIPNTIPTFDIALAAKYEPGMCDWKNEHIFASRKLDGLRGITIIDKAGNVSIWSRGGNQFETTIKIENEIKSLDLRNIVLDGEICLINPDGTDNFSGIISEARKKNHIIENPRYKIFDCLSYDDFLSGNSNVILSLRLQRLKNILGDRKYETLEILHQELVKNDEDLLKW